MAGNTFGSLLRLTTFGESHGIAIGGVLDGFPPGITIHRDLVRADMQRRRPGQSEVTTDRNEEDEVEFLSGLAGDVTLGTPIGFLIRNKDQQSKDYEPLRDSFRPSHADYTYKQKYGLREVAGGGRSSARETACRVAGGALAKQLLATEGVKIQAYVSAIGPLKLSADFQYPGKLPLNPVNCPDPELAAKMIEHIKDLKSKGDSCGGIIEVIVTGCPAGWGEPVFDKLHADLGKAILSINACKGVEFGSGFASAQMKGSEHNDAFLMEGGKVATRTNNSGGIQGGISNGMDILFKAAFKPPSTIAIKQETVNLKGEQVEISGTGRHDPCIVPRAVVVAEAMTALVLADHMLRQNSIKR